MRTCLRVLQLFASIFAIGGSAFAAEYDPHTPPEPYRFPDAYIDLRPYWLPPGQAMVSTPNGFVEASAWEVEVGARYFLSSGETKKDLYGLPASSSDNTLFSRLTYRDTVGHAGEFFGRVDHDTGFFAKGFIGGGVLTGGTLQDEDFPPLTVPYSSTNSDQNGGRTWYGAIDAGWAWKTREFSLGFFVGWFHYFEKVNAYGCAQTAGNTAICAPSVPTSVEVITEETQWDAARLGINGEWRFANRWKLTAEVAWLPYVILNAKDTHYLRTAGLGCAAACSFSGPTPETATDAMTSVQLEALLSYQFSPALSVGVGGRYWNIHTQKGGDAHFEVSGIGGGYPQAIDFKTERWGVFFQTAYKFGQPDAFPTWY